MPGNGGTILLVDDDDSLRRVMQHILTEAGYEVELAESGEAGFRLFKELSPRLVISDVRMTGVSGLDLLTKIKTCRPDAMVLIVTAYGSIDEAVKAIRMGAHDYLGKPFTREQLLLAVSKALAFQGLTQENRKLKAVLAQQMRRELLGDSPEIQQVHQMIRRMAATEASVLILGESGTGKELVAHQIHHQGLRAKKPFIAVNCAAIPKNLLESELFGHRRGAFTGAHRDHKGKFEQADRGTLFLDEVGDLPIDLQPKLLRALQEREITPVGGTTRSVDVRVISATNAELEERVAEGAFREDLYYRLAVLPLHLPPLRERGEDVPLLAQHFLVKYDRGRHLHLLPEALKALKSYPWPGNVRELENLMERLSILVQGKDICREDLPLKILTCSKLDTRGVVHLPQEGYSLEEIEKQAILQALALCSWNKTRAADFLQIPRHVLTYRIEKYALIPD